MRTVTAEGLLLHHRPQTAASSVLVEAATVTVGLQQTVTAARGNTFPTQEGEEEELHERRRRQRRWSRRQLRSGRCSMAALVLALVALGFLSVAAMLYLQPQVLMAALQGLLRRQVLFFFPVRERQSLPFGRRGGAETGRSSNMLREMCALTVDDSPTKNTETLLDVLKESNVKATFFIISDAVSIS